MNQLNEEIRCLRTNISVLDMDIEALEEQLKDCESELYREKLQEKIDDLKLSRSLYRSDLDYRLKELRI
jgi:chromosome segregation ATPase